MADVKPDTPRSRRAQSAPASPVDASIWIASAPALLWTIDVPRSRLLILNDWRHPELGNDAPRLLKDASFRRKRVLGEDQLQLTEFWEAMTAGLPASALFRLAPGGTSWIFLQGWPDPDNKWFYHGILQAAPEYILPETEDSGGTRCPQCRSVANYPVLIIDPKRELVVARNQEAVHLLGRDPSAGPMSFASLVPRGVIATARHALRKAAEEGVWSGALTFRLPNGSTVNSEMRLTTAPVDGKRMVRLAFLNVAGQKRPPAPSRRPAPGTPAGELVRAVARAASLREAMELLLASHEPHAFDGIIYSDIHADKGQVTLYGVGESCADFWGLAFAYEGTIAQNIERHGLNYLVVDDTLDSIKSIDWALFVPRGIRSYYARPFYRYNRLRAVLILCSMRPGAFSLEAAERYEVLAPAFAGAVFRGKPGL